MAHLDGYTLVHFGARKPTMGFPQQPWRLMASVFLHASWWHLLSNLTVIAVWGAMVERLVGGLELLVIFILSGFWGGLISDLYGPSMLAMGASGSALGLVGAAFILAIGTPQLAPWRGHAKDWRMASALALLLTLLLAWGLPLGEAGSRLDHWAHLGGAFCGLFLALPYALTPSSRRRLAFGLGALAMSLGAGVVVHLRPANPFS